MASVFLVDGTFELFRCFHGAPRARNAAGEEVGAARALLATLVSLLVRAEVTHAAVAFDSIVAPARRPAPVTDDALIGAQQPIAADVVRALGLPVWPAGRYQADDLLASGAAMLDHDDRVERVHLCTNDNDLAQCVRGDRVVLLDRIRGVTTDEAAVRAKFGVAPRQIPDLFALVGDRSDGLAGVPGWGAKSAAAVLSRYGRVADIPSDPEQWDVRVRGAAGLAAALRDRRAEALLSRELSVRRADLPVPADLQALAWHGADRPKVDRLVERLEDDAVVGRIPQWLAGPPVERTRQSERAPVPSGEE